MAVTGKTGADAWYKTLQKQAVLIKRYGPKFMAVCATMKGLGLLTDAEYTIITTSYNNVPAVLSAIAKVAEYSGLFD